MSSRLKLRILRFVPAHPGRQTGFVVEGGQAREREEGVRMGVVLASGPRRRPHHGGMGGSIRLGRTLRYQIVDLIGLGPEAKARFESLQTEGRQHQQPRDHGSDHPGHKGEVNTRNVSARSRIVTGPTQVSTLSG